MQDLELKRQKIETWAKWLSLPVAGFLFAPFAYATITGLISLLVVVVIGILTVQIGIPWFSKSVANWRLKAYKAVAAANPIETLENQYAEQKEALLKEREGIKKRIAIVARVYEQIKKFEEQFKKPSPRREQYNLLNQLVEVYKGRYQKAQLYLQDFAKLIEEKRADWDILVSLKEADQLEAVGNDFINKLMKDTALTTIQDGMNTAFAELDATAMDEGINNILNGQPIQVPTAPTKEDKPMKNLVAPSELDFDAETPSPRQKIAVS